MDQREKRGGMGTLSVLTLVFIILRLTGLIDWSWVWVLSPVWIPGLLFAAVFAFILVGGRLKKGKW